MMKNLFAYTAPGSDYPGYVSINRAENGDVSVSVREAPAIREGGNIEGKVAEFTVPAEEWRPIGDG